MFSSGFKIFIFFTMEMASSIAFPFELLKNHQMKVTNTAVPVEEHHKLKHDAWHRAEMLVRGVSRHHHHDYSDLLKMNSGKFVGAGDVSHESHEEHHQYNSRKWDHYIPAEFKMKPVAKNNKKWLVVKKALQAGSKFAAYDYDNYGDYSYDDL